MILVRLIVNDIVRDSAFVWSRPDHPTKKKKVNGRTIWVTTAEVTVGSAADPAEWRVCEDPQLA